MVASNRTSTGEVSQDAFALNSELASLGYELEQLRSQKAIFDDKTEELAVLNSDIESLTKQKSSIIKEVSGLSTKYRDDLKNYDFILESKNSEVLKLDECILLKQSAKDTLLSDIDSLKSQVIELENTKSVKEIEFENFTIKNNNIISNLETDKNILLEDIECLKSKSGILKDSLASLQESCDSLSTNKDTLEQEISAGNLELSNLLQRIDILNIEIKDKESLIAKTEQEKIKEYSELDLIIKNKSGDLSTRESWLVGKENKLREIKAELEVFYGRKITNLNI